MPKTLFLTETFEKLMEISQLPQEKENLLSRFSLLEAQVLQLLNDHLALQGHCHALIARVKSLEDSLANSSTLSPPKMVSSSSMCRRLDTKRSGSRGCVGKRFYFSVRNSGASSDGGGIIYIERDWTQGQCYNNK